MRHENEALVELLKYPRGELADALLKAMRRCVELDNERATETNREEVAEKVRSDSA
jgi:hypothetical protein